jgi:hypothetical protein
MFHEIDRITRRVEGPLHDTLTILAARAELLHMLNENFCNAELAMDYWMRVYNPHTLFRELSPAIRMGIQLADAMLLRVMAKMKVRESVFDGDDLTDPIKCSICLEHIERSTKVSVTEECKHMFHSKCLMEWLKNRRSCPLCRSEL